MAISRTSESYCTRWSTAGRQGQGWHLLPQAISHLTAGLNYYCSFLLTVHAVTGEWTRNPPGNNVSTPRSLHHSLTDRDTISTASTPMHAAAICSLLSRADAVCDRAGRCNRHSGCLGGWCPRRGSHHAVYCPIAVAVRDTSKYVVTHRCPGAGFGNASMFYRAQRGVVTLSSRHIRRLRIPRPYKGVPERRAAHVSPPNRRSQCDIGNWVAAKLPAPSICNVLQLTHTYVDTIPMTRETGFYCKFDFVC